MSHSGRSALALALVLGSSMLSGCGGADLPEIGTVSGTVTMNGAPLVGIDIVSYPAQGRPAFGKVRADGTYELMYKLNVPGTKAGMNIIKPSWTMGGGPAVPKEYAELEFDVQPGANTFDIEMTSDAREWANFAAKSAPTQKQ